ncbi:MAG: 30S ribosomal protein S16, partial [Balneolaceae bacterium]
QPEAKAEEEETVEAEEPVAEEKTEAPEEPKAEVKAAESGQVSTDMNATDAIDHIKNSSVDELKGFVPKDEERVTVQRAWESKQEE